MEIINTVLAGILGTFIMTLFIYVASLFIGNDFRVPAILGSMVTMQAKPSGAVSRSWSAIITGNVLHYTIGVILALAYKKGMVIFRFSNTLSNAILYGIVAGYCAVLFWFIFIKLHPLAPAIKLPLYLTFIFIGHLFFAVGVWLGLFITT